MERYKCITIHRENLSGDSDRASHWVVSCRGRFFKVSSQVVTLLRCLQEADKRADAVSAFKEINGGYTESQISTAIDKVIDPLLAPIPRKDNNPGFIFRRSIVPPRIVGAMAERLKPLFNRYVIILTLIATVALEILYFSQPEDLLNFSGRVGIEGIAVIMAFVLLSSFIHELGHATACTNFGISPGEIGFGIYLNFPLLYTDVTRIWQLPTSRRHIVNIAGVYFQCFFLIAVLCYYFITRDEVARFLILATNLGFIVTLNPFLKFDGYWIATDALDVPNLRNETYNWLKQCFGRSKLESQRHSLISGLSPMRKYFFIGYSVLSIAFLLFYFFYVIPYVLYSSGSNYISDVRLLFSYMANYVTPPFAIVKNVLSYSIFVMTLIYIGWIMIKAIRFRVNRRDNALN